MSRNYWRRARQSRHRNLETWRRTRRDLARLARFLVEHRRELEFLTWSLAIGVLLVLSLAADSGGR